MTTKLNSKQLYDAKVTTHFGSREEPMKASASSDLEYRNKRVMDPCANGIKCKSDKNKTPQVNETIKSHFDAKSNGRHKFYHRF